MDSHTKTVCSCCCVWLESMCLWHFGSLRSSSCSVGVCTVYVGVPGSGSKQNKTNKRVSIHGQLWWERQQHLLVERVVVVRRMCAACIYWHIDLMRPAQQLPLSNSKNNSQLHRNCCCSTVREPQLCVHIYMHRMCCVHDRRACGKEGWRGALSV